MKRLLLFALITQTSFYALSKSVDFTQRDLRTYNNQITSANTKQELMTVLTNFYKTYGDPEQYNLGDNFTKYARQKWQQVSTGPFFDYTQFVISQEATRPSSVSAPAKSPSTKPTHSSVSVPTRQIPSIKVLSSADFVEQLTEQVIKSLNLLKSTLQDPILNQNMTNDQHNQLTTALKEVTTLLNQAGA